MRCIAMLIIVCFLLPACTKSRNTSGPEGKPGIGAPPGAPPGAPAKPGLAPAPPPGAPPTAPAPEAAKTGGGDQPSPAKIPTKDGPALGTLLTGVKSLSDHAEGATATVDNATVVQSVVKSLGTTQTLKGNRKRCDFKYGVSFKDAAGAEMAFLGICAPVGANTVAVFEDKRANNEWQITIPDDKALTALLDKHLPAAKVK